VVEQIVTALVEQAKNGDVAAAKEVFDRCVGKAPQAIAVAATIDGQQSPVASMGCYWHSLVDVEFVGWICARIARGEPIDDFPENAVEHCPLYAEFCIDKALAEDCGGDVAKQYQQRVVESRTLHVKFVDD
jgi:hypothetical protein